MNYGDVPMHPLQAMLDGWSAAQQRERSTTQLTLGKLIAMLSELPQERTVIGFGELMSYRGYYCDLAFEPDTTVTTVAALLGRCRDAMGREFEGYKGGEYMMGESTPLWLSPYGDTGNKLMGLNVEHDPITPEMAPDHV